MPRALAVVGAELEQKRGELKALLDGYSDGKGGWNVPDDKGTEIIQRNEELNTLHDEYIEAKSYYEMAEINDREIKALGQLTAPLPSPASHVGQEAKTLGQMFVESKGYKDYIADHRDSVGMHSIGTFPFDMKTLMQRSAGWAPESLRIPKTVMYASQMPTVIDFIPSAPTSQAAIKYMEETTWTAAGGAPATALVEKAEGAAFNEAALVLTERTVSVQKIPVFLPVTDEQLEDVEGVQSYIEQRLMFMLQSRIDWALLRGTSAAAPLIEGAYASATTAAATTAYATSDEVTLLTAFQAIRSVGFAEPTAVFLHPNVWTKMRLSTVTGAYAMGDPSVYNFDRIWGVPLVQTTVMVGTTKAGTAIAGDFTRFSQLWYRNQITIEVGYDGSNFTEGKKTIRASVRLVPTWYRPTALRAITGLWIQGDV